MQYMQPYLLAFTVSINWLGVSIELFGLFTVRTFSIDQSVMLKFFFFQMYSLFYYTFSKLF